MADQRDGGIAWTDETWNALRGCSRVSEGCRNCYAEGMASRFSGPGQPFEGLIRDGKWNGAVKLVEAKLTDPLRWRRPRRVFVTSVSDPFHDSVTDEMLDRIFAAMALAPQHTFQLLTKRPERMREYLGQFRSCGPRMGWVTRNGERPTSYGGKAECVIADDRWPLPNVWLGVSVENQAAADERIPHLLDTPAAVRFISAEPLLGPVDLGTPIEGLPANYWITWLDRLDWVIAGGESGPKARPMHPDWALSLRDQCAATGVPFLFKQWGEWAPRAWKGDGATHAVRSDGHIHKFDHHPDSLERSTVATPGWHGIERVGKAAAGRLLDGVEHNAFPEARHG